MPSLCVRSPWAPTIFFILSAWLCIINWVSKLASPLPSNFLCLFLAVQVVLGHIFFFGQYLPKLASVGLSVLWLLRRIQFRDEKRVSKMVFSQAWENKSELKHAKNCSTTYVMVQKILLPLNKTIKLYRLQGSHCVLRVLKSSLWDVTQGADLCFSN